MGAAAVHIPMSSPGRCVHACGAVVVGGGVGGAAVRGVEQQARNKA